MYEKLIAKAREQVTPETPTVLMTHKTTGESLVVHAVTVHGISTKDISECDWCSSRDPESPMMKDITLLRHRIN